MDFTYFKTVTACAQHKRGAQLGGFAQNMVQQVHATWLDTAPFRLRELSLQQSSLLLFPRHRALTNSHVATGA